MRFAVPQFIDVEDKIFGPLTLKQAIYVGGGAGVILAIFTKLGFLATILFGIPIGLFAGALAFLKINHRPFYLIVYAAFFYTIHNKLYLWKKLPKKKAATAPQKEATTTQPVHTAPAVTQSSLKELAWSLDTRDSMYTDNSQKK